MGNAARRAAVPWLAKANLPVEGSYKGWSRGGVGSRISISTCTICCCSLQGEGVRESIDQVMVVFGGDILGCSRVKTNGCKLFGVLKNNPKNPPVCGILSVAFSMSMALRLAVSINICREFITQHFTCWSNAIYYYFLMVYLL